MIALSYSNADKENMIDEIRVSCSSERLYISVSVLTLCIAGLCWSWGHSASSEMKHDLYFVHYQQPSCTSFFVDVFHFICGALTIYNLRKLMGKKPGLILNEAGITDHSSLLSVGYSMGGHRGV